MFILKGFKGVKTFEKFHCPKSAIIRLFCVENALGKDSPRVARKYLKPVSTNELSVLKDDFLKNLFAGVVDKRLFEYPTVLKESHIGIVLDHSAEVEGFLTNASREKLTDDTIRKLRELELFGLSIPQKYGGAGYNETESTFLRECMGTNPTIGRFLGYNENFGCKLLNLYGSEEQKEKYLPGLAQGKTLASFAYLETGPLIDLSKMEAHAVQDEENKTFIVNAVKKWVHDADKADIFFVVAKTSTLCESDLEVQINFKTFIVERDTPGVTIHKLKSEFAQENNVYDVSFNEVVIPQNNILGSKDLDGYHTIKSAIAHSNVTDGAVCCNLLKHITHDVMQFIHEKSQIDSSGIDHSLVQENVVSLVMYMYALESVIYLITGRYDTFDNPDLFYESVFAKTLGVEFLQIGIKKYIEILGREAFKSSGVLEEAMSTAQYYSVFEENIEYLKIMCAAEGLVHAAGKLNQKVRMIRRPYEHNWEALKWRLSSSQEEVKKQRRKLNFRLELHECLKAPADCLEQDFAKFQVSVEEFFIKDGRTAIDNEHAVARFGDMAAYLYACIACLSRASSSVCYNFENYENEVKLAGAFAHVASSKIRELHEEELRHINLMEHYVNIGEETFNRKHYPVEHPLARTF